MYAKIYLWQLKQKKHHADSPEPSSCAIDVELSCMNMNESAMIAKDSRDFRVEETSFNQSRWISWNDISVFRR